MNSVEKAAERFDLIACDGERLAGYRWRADAPRGVLLLLHGYAEHAGRHARLATAAAAAGLDAWAFDQRNHGHSPGAVRGSVDGYETTLADLAALQERALGELCDRGREPPVFLFGHSMGGALALRYALDHPERLRGLVLSAPFLRDAAPRPAWLANVVRPLAALVPTLPTARIPATSISRSDAEATRYAEDPLIYHGGVRFAAAMTMLGQGAALLRSASALTVPTLVVHGGGDRVAALAGSQALAAAAERVELRVLDGGFHELHHDDDATGVPDEVRCVVLDWLARRL